MAPVGPLVLTIGIGALFPDVSFTTDYGAFLRGLELPEEQFEASVAVLEGLPVPPVVFLVGQGLVAGLRINAVAALGEEPGWRGLLLRELSPLGFRRVSLLTGTVWGVWHAPIIVQGHNFPAASDRRVGRSSWCWLDSHCVTGLCPPPLLAGSGRS